MPRLSLAAFAATATAALVAALPAAPSSALTGGPDAGGYSYTDSTEAGGPAAGPFTSIAPANGGSGTDLGGHCDDNCVVTYTLPFPVSFYDETATQVQVSPNGNIQLLSSSTVYTPGNLPDGRFDTVLEGYFKDLRTDGDGNGVFVQTSGATGHRTITFEWRTVLYSDNVTPEQFQIVLHEDSEDVDMRYLDINTSDSNGIVGIQGGDGSGARYLQYGAEPTDNLAIRFTRSVAGNATRTALTATPAAGSVHGQTVKLSAKVTAVSSTGTAPTGTVTFYDGSTALGTAPVSKGAAKLSVKSLTTGTHQLLARYSGDTTYRPSANRAISYEVSQASTTTTVTVPESGTAKYGDQAVSAAVKAVAPGKGTPTGYVNWYDNGEFLTSTNLVKGKATLDGRTLEPGDHQLRASYSGDENNQTSASANTSLTVTKASATVTAKGAPNPVAANKKVTLSATVKLSSKELPYDGQVVFRAGDVVFEGGTFSNGKATLVLNEGLPSGSYTITASYENDPHVADASASFVLTVS